jgi:LacI family transcriptional regulator
MGDAAVEMLVKRIEQDPDSSRVIEMPINLIIRQSTDLRGDKNWDLYDW